LWKNFGFFPLFSVISIWFRAIPASLENSISYNLVKMKALKHIAAVIVAVLTLSSCSVLSGGMANGASSGRNTGSALLALYNIYQAAGGNIDLSNAANIVNIGKILTGAGTLANATSTYMDQFKTGLLNGATGLVNNSNVSKVMSGLQTLSSIDPSAFKSAAKTAASNAASSAVNSAVSAANSKTAGVATTLSTLNSIFGALK
jgi:hypothetical protein